MPQYRFPLEAVLKDRKIRQDRIQMALAERERTYQRLQDRLAEVRRLQRESAQHPQDQAWGSTGFVLRLYHQYLVRLKDEAEQLLRHLQQEAEALRSLRLALRERSKECRVVEKLKENGYRRFLAELRSGEQRILDETAGVFHRRSQKRLE